MNTLEPLTRAGFEIVGEELDAKFRVHLSMVAQSVPFEILQAVASIKIVSASSPSADAFSLLKEIYRKKYHGKFREKYFLACWGYLPVALPPDPKTGVERYGHPWVQLSDSPLILDTNDPVHLGCFLLFQASVARDAAEDRKATVTGGRLH